jgi:hypothetical protein
MFFPLLFGGAAIAFGFVNIIRRRWDHGLLQIVLALAVIVSFVNGVTMSHLTVPYFNSLTASLR